MMMMMMMMMMMTKTTMTFDIAEREKKIETPILL